LPKKQVHDLLADFVAAIITNLQAGARIRMSGLGTLEVKRWGERTGRNPAGGEAMQIKASKKVVFRPAKELKEPLNKPTLSQVRPRPESSDDRRLTPHDLSHPAIVLRQISRHLRRSSNTLDTRLPSGTQ
jgi:DNA-binding protein HU-beta